MVNVKGFTLLELMIVVAIVAILAAISYPMYTQHTVRAACDGGKSGLLQADALMNQLYIKHGVYYNVDTENGALPGMSTIPAEGSGNVDFDVTITVAADQPKKYTITATPSAAGRLGRYSGTLTIDQSGQRDSTLGGVNVWTEGCKALTSR